MKGTTTTIVKGTCGPRAPNNSGSSSSTKVFVTAHTQRVLYYLLSAVVLQLCICCVSHTVLTNIVFPEASLLSLDVADVLVFGEAPVVASLSTTGSEAHGNNNILLPLFPEPSHAIQRRNQGCPPKTDFLQFIRNRPSRWNGKHYKSHEMWQKSINDKLGCYIFGKNNGVRVPEILACGDSVDTAFKSFDPPKGTGFVVKMKTGHSSLTTWVFTSGFSGMEVLSRKNMTREELKNRIAKQEKIFGTGYIFVEELIHSPISGEPPIDYKFHMFNGQVGGVYIMAHRGTSKGCTLCVDEDFNRTDRWHFDNKIRETEVVQNNDFGLFRLEANYTKEPCPEKGSFGNCNCGDYQKPKQWEEMVAVAKLLSKRIGIYMRVDMFINAQGEVVLGELTPFHTSGNWHCAGKTNAQAGTVDGCWLGKLWRDHSEGKSSMEGGPITVEPDYLKGWSGLKHSQKCEVALAFAAASKSQQ